MGAKAPASGAQSTLCTPQICLRPPPPAEGRPFHCKVPGGVCAGVAGTQRRTLGDDHRSVAPSRRRAVASCTTYVGCSEQETGTRGGLPPGQGLSPEEQAAPMRVPGGHWPSTVASVHKRDSRRRLVSTWV